MRITVRENRKSYGYLTERISGHLYKVGIGHCLIVDYFAGMVTRVILRYYAYK